jgi:demethylspheroidene O-methyltransferase
MMQDAVAFPALDRLHAARDRLLGNASFRRWAARFPLTRWIVRRRARAAFDLCAGFVYSQVLLACVRLRLFEILAERPQTAPVLARRLALGVASTERLLAAAVSLRLVARRGPERFGLGELGASIVGEPAIAAMVEHNALLYADLQDPVALLRGAEGATALARYWPYAGATEPAALPVERIAAYSNLMSASQPLVAGEILGACPLERHRCLLDVGGGDGTFLCAVAARYPHLQLVLFDLPAVAERAKARFSQEGLQARAQCVGGDFRAGPLPQGADVVSLVRVVHDHDDEAVLAILRNVRRALPAGGLLLLAEPMSGTPGAEAMGDAYFGMYLLAMGSGRTRSFGELARLVRAAGFVDVRHVPTEVPLQTSLLLARAG